MSGEAAFGFSVLITFLMALVSWWLWQQPSQLFVIEFIKAVLNANTKKINEHEGLIASLQKRIKELESKK